MRRGRALLGVLLAWLCLAACAPAPASLPAPAPLPTPAPLGEDAVRVASYDFPENQVLAEVYAEAVRRTGLRVVVQHAVGTREVVLPALEQGVVDVVVDYLGAAAAFVRPGEPAAPRPPEELHAELAATLAGRGASVLAPAAAEDRNGFAVLTSFADRHGVGRLSDLVDLAPGLTFGGPPECPQRRHCLPGLREVYDLRFAAFRSMPSRAATVEALLSGEVDVGLLETTDPRLADAPLVLLLDDRSLQPHENVVPIVRTEVLDRAGEELRRALDAVSARLSTTDLVQLNRAVAVEGMTPAEAAAAWWAAG